MWGSVTNSEDQEIKGSQGLDDAGKDLEEEDAQVEDEEDDLMLEDEEIPFGAGEQEIEDLSGQLKATKRKAGEIEDWDKHDDTKQILWRFLIYGITD
ncbi:hypothetical protein F0562_034684 [Nyssa sinensis]|uniref:Uncharacterized protein n=1 Tax=Nyssa sinensis TaxID=561372 RepID=A0A5J5AAA4_9ASTE|nr:hypothetical protein F0562_034684 [Nyssa sinensis]